MEKDLLLLALSFIYHGGTLSTKSLGRFLSYQNIREYCRILKSKFNWNSANAKFELRSVLYNVRKTNRSLIFITESNEET